MNRKILVLPLLMTLLVSCRKTENALEHGKYLSSDFDKNYYTEWDDVGKSDFQIGNTKEITTFLHTSSVVSNFTPAREKNMCNIEDKFSYGYLSKLYDGNLVCNGYYAASRVQLNKTGYATCFPKEFVTGNGFAFAVRGGTTIDWGVGSHPTNAKINLSFKFYIRRESTLIYDVVDFKFTDLLIESDHGGSTTYVDCLFDAEQLAAVQGADAMSMTFELSDPTSFGHDITDDYTTDPNKEKAHFALMLYEVYFDESQWR